MDTLPEDVLSAQSDAAASLKGASEAVSSPLSDWLRDPQGPPSALQRAASAVQALEERVDAFCGRLDAQSRELRRQESLYSCILERQSSLLEQAGELLSCPKELEVLLGTLEGSLRSCTAASASPPSRSCSSRAQQVANDIEAKIAFFLRSQKRTLREREECLRALPELERRLGALEAKCPASQSQLRSLCGDAMLCAHKGVSDVKRLSLSQEGLYSFNTGAIVLERGLPGALRRRGVAGVCGEEVRKGDGDAEERPQVSGLSVPKNDCRQRDPRRPLRLERRAAPLPRGGLGGPSPGLAANAGILQAVQALKMVLTGDWTRFGHRPRSSLTGSIG